MARKTAQKQRLNQPQQPQTVNLETISSEELALMLQEQYRQAAQAQKNIWSINAEITKRMNNKKEIK